MNAEQWNAMYPVGTPVFAYPGFRPQDDPDARRLVTRTRSKAQKSSSGHDVVWVDGEGSYITLTHVDPLLDEFDAFTCAATQVPHNPRPVCRTPAAPVDGVLCAVCGWNELLHDDEEMRAAIDEALKCLPDGVAAEPPPTPKEAASAAPAGADTLPAWLARRFDPNSTPWDGMSDDDRTYWQHQARAVRRAAARGGFKDAGFFQPGHVYAHGPYRFRCEYIVTHPTDGRRSAWGWFGHEGRGWRHQDFSERQFQVREWTDVTGEEAAS